jgi:hypothetical protein
LPFSIALPRNVGSKSLHNGQKQHIFFQRDNPSQQVSLDISATNIWAVWLILTLFRTKISNRMVRSPFSHGHF